MLPCLQVLRMLNQLHGKVKMLNFCLGGEDPLRLNVGVWCFTFYSFKPIPVVGQAGNLQLQSHSLSARWALFLLLFKLFFSVSPGFLQEFLHSPFIRKQGNIYKPNNKDMDNESLNEKTMDDVHTKEIDLVNRDPKLINDDIVKVSQSWRAVHFWAWTLGIYWSFLSIFSAVKAINYQDYFLQKNLSCWLEHLTIRVNSNDLKETVPKFMSCQTGVLRGCAHSALCYCATIPVVSFPYKEEA